MLDLQNEDATTTLMHAESEINVERPPQLLPGAIQHTILALNVDTIFPGPGDYRVVASIDGDKSTASWSFRVRATHVPVRG